MLDFCRNMLRKKHKNCPNFCGMLTKQGEAVRREINAQKQPGRQPGGLCMEPAFQKHKAVGKHASRTGQEAEGGGSGAARRPCGGSQARTAPRHCPGPAPPPRPHLPGAGGRGTAARPLLRLLREGPGIRRSRRRGTAAPPDRRQPRPPRPKPYPGGGKAPARRRHDCPRGGRCVNSDPAPRPGHRHAPGAGAPDGTEAGRPPSWLRERPSGSRAAASLRRLPPSTAPGGEARHGSSC